LLSPTASAGPLRSCKPAVQPTQNSSFSFETAQQPAGSSEPASCMHGTDISPAAHKRLWGCSTCCAAIAQQRFQLWGSASACWWQWVQLHGATAAQQPSSSNTGFVPAQNMPGPFSSSAQPGPGLFNFRFHRPAASAVSYSFAPAQPVAGLFQVQHRVARSTHSGPHPQHNTQPHRALLTRRTSQASSSGSSRAARVLPSWQPFQCPAAPSC
jgi:hypothetical protein